MALYKTKSSTTFDFTQPYYTYSFHLLLRHTDDGPAFIGQEAEKILQWLRTKKCVSEIMELYVPGSVPCMESDEVIEKALQGISVDHLDWTVLNLSIETVLQ